MSFSRNDVKWISFSSESNKQEICYRKYSKPLASLSFSVVVSVFIKKGKECYSVFYTILLCKKDSQFIVIFSALKQYCNGALVFLVSGRSRRGRTGYSPWLFLGRIPLSMELSDTVVYLKVFKQSNCIELLACGVFLKNERKNLEWNAFLLWLSVGSRNWSARAQRTCQDWWWCYRFIWNHQRKFFQLSYHCSKLGKTTKQPSG